MNLKNLPTAKSVVKCGNPSISEATLVSDGRNSPISLYYGKICILIALLQT